MPYEAMVSISRALVKLDAKQDDPEVGAWMRVIGERRPGSAEVRFRNPERCVNGSCRASG